MSEIKLVLVTFPAGEEEQVSHFAKGFVEEKLAACVNRIKNVESYYEWEGELNVDNEEQLLIKTKESCIPQVKEYVRKNHPYDTPEMIVLDVVDGSDDYLEWVRKSTE